MDTVTIPKTLQKKLRRISEETGQRPEQLVAAALEEKLRYEEWLLRRIDAGLSDLKAGWVFSTKELVSIVAVAHQRRRFRNSHHPAHCVGTPP